MDPDVFLNSSSSMDLLKRNTMRTVAEYRQSKTVYLVYGFSDNSLVCRNKPCSSFWHLGSAETHSAYSR
ncbi:ZZ type zinc finger domain protein [Aspergillus luchuensis]|uniref:ZZ type zinc finger domain protein n=1 Tax=Aspergillus kawachii TaxID=1069201 RepID=A0A146F2M9_ASPKA|nr:ZZ type zinc finger domain protein [Aspergillus luchuensis]